MTDQQQIELLREAVATIMECERRDHPEKDESFWEQFGEVVLSMAILEKDDIFSTGGRAGM